MKSIIAWMTSNRVAANLLMLFALVAGVLSALSVEQEVFPEFDLQIVEVRVPYPGGSPDAVERGIVRRIEERLEGIEGVKDVTAVASADAGLVRAELELGEDDARRLDEIKAEVDRITSFPEEADEPVVTLLSNRQRALEIALYGPTDPVRLKRQAYRLEEELTALPEVSYVEVVGRPQFEISVEPDRDALRAYGLTLQDMAAAIDRSSLDLPAGELEGAFDEVAIRVQTQRYRGSEFEDIVVLSQPSGAQVRLRDVAEVRDAFSEAPVTTRFNGQPAVMVQVFRTGDEQVLEIADAVHEYVDHQLPEQLPAGIQATIWQDDAERLRARFQLLLENGALGLVLVIVTLALFLEIRLALWVAGGILVAFVGTFTVMQLVDASVNMLTLFGFILAIGIVVDDAIVVGENVFHAKTAEEPERTSIQGAARVARPVIFAVTTTALAFVPLLFIPGSSGKFLGQIPVVVLGVLGLSLVESLLVLPHHLAKLSTRPPGKIRGFFGALQRRVDGAVQRFVKGPLRRAVRFSVRRPFTVVAAAAALMMITVTTLAAGYVRFTFLPEIESDLVRAQIEMPAGTTAERTSAVAERVARAGERITQRLQEEQPDDAAPLVRNVGMGVSRPLVLAGSPQSQTDLSDPSVADVVIQLSDPQDRELSATTVEDAWRREVGQIAGVENISFSATLIDFGAPVQVELSSANDADLLEALERVEKALRDIDGVYDIRNDWDIGKREVRVSVDETGRALGLTDQALALQLRASLFGVEAQRMQRGAEEVRVYVRLPDRQQRDLHDLYALRIDTPGGDQVPLREIAEISQGRAPTTINRRNGRRIATVRAAVDESKLTGNEATSLLSSEILPKLREDLPGLRWEFGGEQREQAESLPALARNFGLALLAIYSVLAIAFSSYSRPLVVMSAIPLGFVGAVAGHLALGLDISLLSLFGIIGLSGVIVNDALVMLDFIDERRRKGDGRREAIVAGACRRFRPILLTSLTTFLGVFPLVVEQSIQAQFLIPLAVSLGFGVLLGTVLLMLGVTALAELQMRWTED